MLRGQVIAIRSAAVRTAVAKASSLTKAGYAKTRFSLKEVDGEVNDATANFKGV